MGNQQLRKGEIYKMNNLMKKIKERFPEENIEILHYTIMKEPASVKCLTCDTIYELSAAENFVRKSKKCICKKCINNHTGGRLSLKDFQEKINLKYPNEKLEVIEYTLTKEPCKIKCLKCGNIYSLTEAGLFTVADKKRVCKNCVPNKVEQARQTKEDFLNFIKESSFELVTDISEDSFRVTTPVTCRCKNCGETSEKTIYDYMRGRTCKYCAGNQLLTKEEYQNFLGDEYTILSDYKGKDKSVLLRHNLCGFCYKKNARYYHCPKCSGSQGEQKIDFLLSQKNISFIREKEENINNHKLRFDFYLPDYDVYIEYQGEQHSKAIPYFGGEEMLKKQQLYDSYKVDWVNKNNKKLLIINYNEDIQIKLFNFLLKFNDHLVRE